MKLFSILLLPIFPSNLFFNSTIFIDNIYNKIIKEVKNDEVLKYYDTKFRLQCRVKKPDRYYQKMFENYQFPNDLFGIRIIYDNPYSLQNEFISYLILNNIERNNMINRNSYNDYIMNKKDNGYQSLHVNILTNYLFIFYTIELQIRCEEMDYYNNFGPPNDYYISRQKKL